MPQNFMASVDVCGKLRECIEKLEDEEVNQKNLDNLNDEFCSIIHKEMEENLESRNVRVPNECKKNN